MKNNNNFDKNNQLGENNDNNNNTNNLDSNKAHQYYNLLKENMNNENENDKNYNLNDYYYYLKNYDKNRNFNNTEEEMEPKKIVSFATKTYQGRIDPVKLNRQYNNFWLKHNKSKNKYKEKMEALKKVFNPHGYNRYPAYKSVIFNNKKRGLSHSRYSVGITENILDRPNFDNTKQPLPKQSYLVVPYDYGINDPNYGKEDPINYDRKKMVKLRMLKQPLKYYYPYTKNKKLIKYE